MQPVTDNELFDDFLKWLNLSKDDVNTEKFCLQIQNKWKSEVIDGQNWYHSYISKNLDSILRVSKMYIYPYINIIVDKSWALDNNGIPKIITNQYGKYEHVLSKTSVKDSKELPPKSIEPIQELRVWLPESLKNKRAPVVIHISPKTIDDFLSLCNYSELPSVIRFSNLIEKYTGLSGNYNVTINLNKFFYNLH